MKRLVILLQIMLTMISCSDRNKGSYELPPNVEYQNKAKEYGWQDSVIMLPGADYDTLRDERGKILERKAKQVKYKTLLTGDRIEVYLPYRTKVTVLIDVPNDLYDERDKKFKRTFRFDADYDKKKKCYYVLKSQLPTLHKKQYNGYDIEGVFFDYTPKEIDIDEELYKVAGGYVYHLSESHVIYKNSLGKGNPSEDLMIVKHNQVTMFTRWLTGDLTVYNIYTDR